jgi:hypothetical protein
MRFQGDKAVTRPAGNPGSNAKKLHRQVRGFDGTLGTSTVSPDHINRSSIVVVWNRDCSYPYLVETALCWYIKCDAVHAQTHAHTSASKTAWGENRLGNVLMRVLQYRRDCWLQRQHDKSKYSHEE